MTRLFREKASITSKIVIWQRRRISEMDFLEKHKTVVVEHEIVVHGVIHKERKEVTTVTSLCETCHPYEGDKCPCPEAKGPLKKVRKHECRIGDNFYEVCEVMSDSEVLQ